MIVLKILAVVIAAVVILFLVFLNINKWATSLQKYYIAQSNKLQGNNGGWDEPWRIILFKVMICFFGLMAVLGVYVAVFSQQ